MRDKTAISNLYDARVGEDLPDYKKVGWGSKESQELRFQILSGIGLKENYSVLDVGCGLGDLFDFLTKGNPSLEQYLGIDISKNLLAEAEKRYVNEPKAKFSLTDIEDLTSKQNSFDYVFMSGALNLKMKEDNWNYATEVVRSMFDICKVGLACNFLSSYVDYSHDKDFHYEPERMFSFARSLTKRVALRHDYPLYEFTLYLYK